MDVPVYLDCNATTPVEPEVADIARFYLEREYGNAGSHTHLFGTRARAAVEQARKEVAETAGVSPGSVIFTSGATESNNLALLGLRRYALETGRTQIVTSQIEHKAVLAPLAQLASEGFEIVSVSPNRSGYVDASKILEALSPKTCAISLMHANNETGVIQPITEVAERLEDNHVIFHVDAAQTFGKLLHELTSPRLDMISVSAHKVYGPKGVGALIVKRRPTVSNSLTPLIFGGEQERGLRSGTLPVPLIAGFGMAARISIRDHNQRLHNVQALRSELIQMLEPLGAKINGDTSRLLPHCLNLRIPGIDADAILVATKDRIAASTGSACTSERPEPSHVLLAMGLTPEDISESFRLSWCHMTPVPDYTSIANAIQLLA